MKTTIKQLLFKLSDKDFERYGDELPYAFISFHPNNLQECDKEVLIFHTKEDYQANKGIISYISYEIEDSICIYECTPLT